MPTSLALNAWARASSHDPMSSINPLADANWDRSAGEYDRFEKRWHYYGRVAERLVGHLGIGADSRVLELASGTGACTLLLSRLCPEGGVVCVERSRAMVAIAKGNARAAGLENVTFLQGDARELPGLVAGMERFAFAVCNSAFWQFPEPEGVAGAVERSLSPGGLFAFNIPSLFSFTTERRAFRSTVDRILEEHGLDRSRFWRVRRRKDFRALLEGAGFEVIEDSRYYVRIGPEQAREWRRIPVFARRWGNFDGLPREASAEILEAVKEARLGDRERRSKWRMLVGRKPKSARSPSVK
jgi:ubiquinone/menaquinone biosynthesis C-methylase UbiE